VKPGASLHVCYSSSWQREFQNALEAAGFDVRCQIIWAKTTFAWGFGRYKFQHEPLFYAHLSGEKDPWYGDKIAIDVVARKQAGSKSHYPTAEPVELIERALLNSGKAGVIVVDLRGLLGGFRRLAGRGGGCAFFGCHLIFSYGGDYRGHDIRPFLKQARIVAESRKA